MYSKSLERVMEIAWNEFKLLKSLKSLAYNCPKASLEFPVCFENIVTISLHPWEIAVDIIYAAHHYLQGTIGQVNITKKARETDCLVHQLI